VARAARAALAEARRAGAHFQLNSSLRAEPPEVTLARARAVAAQLGVTRVTEITRLDWAGVPVYASIRPDALPGSLCVNAGKGITPLEAQVGAYMEAIEYAFAEYGRSRLRVVRATPRDVLDGRERPDAILDFCPVMGAEIALDAEMACIEAEDVVTDERWLVPAELVFLPTPAHIGPRYFGSNSNGLASGNTLLEATVHALAEVIERDLCSFQSVEDRSALVEPESLPPPASEIARSLAPKGLELHVRSLKNEFGLPFFAAAVAEPEGFDPVFVSAGFGCHPARRIALVRAVCEAFQSRLSFIHGGRDDLTERHARFEGWPAKRRARYASRLLAKFKGGRRRVRFERTDDHERELDNLEAAQRVMLAALARNGFRRVLRVRYTPADFPLQVVRVLVPGLECFTETSARVGPRLRDYVRDRL